MSIHKAVKCGSKVHGYLSSNASEGTCHILKRLLYIPQSRLTAGWQFHVVPGRCHLGYFGQCQTGNRNSAYSEITEFWYLMVNGILPNFHHSGWLHLKVFQLPRYLPIKSISLTSKTVSEVNHKHALRNTLPLGLGLERPSPEASVVYCTIIGNGWRMYFLDWKYIHISIKNKVCAIEITTFYQCFLLEIFRKMYKHVHQKRRIQLHLLGFLGTCTWFEMEPDIIYHSKSH